MTEFILREPHPLEVKENRFPLTFHFSIHKDYNNETIPIVVLHGFGEYSGSKYMNSLHNSLTTNYNVAILTVNYVGTFTNLKFTHQNSPYNFLHFTTEITEGENKIRFLQILSAIFNNNASIINWLKDNNAIIHNDFSCYKKTIEQLIFKIENNMCDGMYILERLYEIGFTSAITSMTTDTKKDHQDFGLIQAIDVLTAINHIKQISKYKNIDWGKLSIVGLSHGGYIASMCDKIAPNTFQTIVNNSGWTESVSSSMLPLNSTKISYLNVDCTIYENNYWSNEPSDINFLSERHKEIRKLGYIQHLEEQKLQTKNINNKRYIFSHTKDDHLIPLQKKDEYITLLKAFYNNVTYIRIDSENKLDGKTFKDFTHGAKASLKGLVIDFIINNTFDSKISDNDFDLNSIIHYNCTNGTYIIDYSTNYPTILFVSS